MTDEEQSKLDAKLRENAPQLEKLSRPVVMPDRVREALHQSLDRKIEKQRQSKDLEQPSAEDTSAILHLWLKKWRWWLGFAVASAAAILVLVSQGWEAKRMPVVQIALLDSIGVVRGSNENPMRIISRQWKQAESKEFDDLKKANLWQEAWPDAPKQVAVKILYNRDSNQLRVTIRQNGKNTSERTFPVPESGDLPKALAEATAFIEAQMK